MLALWLFSIVVSWANACILGDAGRSGGRSLLSDAAVVQPLHADGHDHDSDGHGGDAGRKACKRFCDTERSVAAKS